MKVFGGPRGTKERVLAVLSSLPDTKAPDSELFRLTVSFRKVYYL